MHERAKAKIIKRSKNPANPFPYGVQILEGLYEGITFALKEMPKEKVDTEVIAVFKPRECFAEID